jgi:hypothetical protein
MNERIRLLAEQAKKYALDAMIKITDKEQALKVYSETYDTKFAEMIVRECIDIAGKEDFDVMMKEGYPCSQTAKNIKEHFGVKE